MMKINAVFCLALMFGLGTCAVVNMKPTVNEEQIDPAETILSEMLEVHQDEGTFEDSVSDVELQNGAMSTDAFKNENLTCPRMRCIWRSRCGACNINAPRCGVLIVRMKIGRYGIHFALWYHHRIFKRVFMRYGCKRFVRFAIGRTTYLLQITERKRYCGHVIVCFKITVRYGCRRRTYNYGCSSNIYKVTDSQEVKGITDRNFDLKNCMESKAEDVENFIESDPNENSLMWDENAESKVSLNDMSEQ